MLLGNQSRTDAGAEVLVQESGDLLGVDVLPALEEAPRQYGDRVRVRSNELGERVGELDLILGGADGSTLGRGAPVRQEDGERMEVGVVDSRNVGIRDDDVGEITEGLEAVGKANREEGEREVCGGEEGVLGEGRAAVSEIQSALNCTPSQATRKFEAVYLTRSARLRGC